MFGTEKEVELGEGETEIVFTRTEEGYLDSQYIFKVIKAPSEAKVEVKETEEKKEVQIELPIEKLVEEVVYMFVKLTNTKGETTVEGKVVNNDTNKVTVEVTEEKEVKECKVLFWESLANLKPVYKPVEKDF